MDNFEWTTGYYAHFGLYEVKTLHCLFNIVAVESSQIQVKFRVQLQQIKKNLFVFYINFMGKQTPQDGNTIYASVQRNEPSNSFCPFEYHMDIFNQSCPSGRTADVHQSVRPYDRSSCVPNTLTMDITRKLVSQILLYISCLYAPLTSTIIPLPLTLT